MASLEQSLKLKAAGTAGPSLSGPRPLIQAEQPLGEGKSGGIAKSKATKNAGSSSVVVPKVAPDSRFILSLGGSSQSDKSGGYH